MIMHNLILPIAYEFQCNDPLPLFVNTLSDVIGDDVIEESYAICVLTAKSQFFARLTKYEIAKCCFPVNLRYKSENLNKI